MWIRGQTRAIVNLDYVTAVEARVMEASYSLSRDREPQWEVIAYRRPPGQDAVLANMLPAKTAAAIVDRLGGAIMAEATLVDVMDLLDEVRYSQNEAAAKEKAAAHQESREEEPAAVTPT